ncbi:MAG: polysaccharide export protein [Candidatus Sumerlaeota bacterium]|nr:polysaccharide export protein [Candidatus Sumerlaeota bacterium]
MHESNAHDRQADKAFIEQMRHKRLFVALLAAFALFFFNGCTYILFPSNVRPYNPAQQPDRSQEAMAAVALAQELRQTISEDAYIYRIHPTDVVEIKVMDYEKFNLTTRVGISGKINFYPLGEIQAAGLTQVQLETAIKKGLEGKYLKNPNVIVTVSEAKSQNITVLGEVHSPGKQAIWGEVTLLDVLAQAGGVNPTASNIAYLTRANTKGAGAVAQLMAENKLTSSTVAGGAASTTAGVAAERIKSAAPITTESLFAQTKVFRIYLAGLLQRGERDWDIPLQPGDVLNFPPAGFVHVSGSGIEKPGTYPLAFQPKTLSQIIDEAGGITMGADRRIIIGRPFAKDSNKLDLFWINIRQARKDAQYDIAIEPGDRIAVIPSPIMQTVSAIQEFAKGLAFGYSPKKFPEWSTGFGTNTGTARPY